MWVYPSANKNSVKIIGDNTDKYCQAYFSYDSKKSGGFTCSHLRFGDSPIHSTYLVNTPNFVACHVQAYLNMYDVTRGLQKNGQFLLNTIFEGDELVNFIPNKVKRYFAENNITVYYINATKIAQEIGLGNRTNTILQSAFFRITEVIPVDFAVEKMKAAALKSYGKKGQDVVDKNYAAIDRGGEYKTLAVDPAWANLADDVKVEDDAPAFVKELVRPINAQMGGDLKVSDFVKFDTVDGTWQNGTAAYEKRGVAAFVPEWDAENCIECNQCSYVCPHACIRPFAMTDEEKAGFAGQTREMKAPAALKGMHFTMQVGVLDCLGCGNCVDVCPGKPGKDAEGNKIKVKALKMVAYDPTSEKDIKEAQNWDYCVKNVKTKQDLMDITSNVKNSQFATPLFEFSGACSGCGETPYVKLISQLFGDRQMVANATGCSSIYSASIPSTPYTKNEKGQGPAFDNSLFEDFCEFGLGMHIGNKKMKERVAMLLQQVIDTPEASAEYKAAAAEWIEKRDDAAETKRLAAILKPFIAEGAAQGKRVRKKDLGMIATTYGYVYVAQIAMGADQAQTLKAFREAEAYPGPSLVIAYAPCINHGLKAKGGMGKSQAEEAKAVECGYWHLWRYNPLLAEEGKNPFTLDSKEPQWDKFQDFLEGEVRYLSVKKAYPNEAQELFDEAKKMAQLRYNSYVRKSNEDWSNAVSE